VIIRDLDFVSVTISPGETYPEFIVYSDGMLAFAVPVQSMQTVPRWNSQVVQPGCGVHHLQFSLRYVPQLSRGPFAAFTGLPELARVVICEGLDHEWMETTATR
jgi:hypothetical protein